MFKNAFETSSRITKPGSGSGAWLRVGSEDSPFIGVKLGIYAFSTRGDAENAYRLALDILQAADEFNELQDDAAQNAREELFERYATELIEN